MYTMRTTCDNKVLYLTQCCFCEHVRITREVTCKKHPMLSDNCADMKTVENVSERFYYLFATLPNGYKCQ